MRVFLTGNYTQELLANILGKFANEEKLDLDIHLSGFNQYRQEIINPNAELYQLNPDIVFLSIDLFTLVEDIIYSNDADRADLFEKRLSETMILLNQLDKNLNGTQVFIDNFFFKSPVSMSTLEYNSPFGYLPFENIANSELYKTAGQLKNIKIVDVKGLVSESGSENLFDNRMHYLAKSHWNHNGLKQLAKLYIRYIKAFKGIRKKCIVLDLDNTLWGGILGDDGMENIKLSNDGEGKAFYDFQRELLKLYKRGILLAINSKNTEEIVRDTMLKHPYMILKPEHFISMKVNWNNKAQNMKEIADEINIGLDSLVFLDDSEFEREVIKSQFPEIFTPELPKDFSDYPSFLRSLDKFDFLGLTGDDFARNKMYKANVQRDQLKKETINIEEFYYSLDMVATVRKIEDFHVPRIAQMTQKTNQFNLRTKRYTEADIKNFKSSPDHEVYYLSLADKFGDNGIVGTAIVHKEENQFFIDSFIFSCRALGRTAETALLNYIINDVADKGVNTLTGEYIPTKKNMPCKDFYENHNFTKKPNNFWEIRIDNYKAKKLPWIKINPN